MFQRSVLSLVIFEQGTVDHELYIPEVFPVAVKFGKDMFRNNWTFQQDGGRPHIRQTTQDWCLTYLPSFIDKEHCLPNNPDLNPLSCCIWDVFAGAINWDLTISKAILINQLKLRLKKICSEVVFESCIYFGPIDCIEWNKLMATVYIHKVGLLL